MTRWRFPGSRLAERYPATFDSNSKITPLVVVAAILITVGAAVVIARGDSAEQIAHDARVMSSSQSVSSAAAALNAEVREGLLVTQASAAGVFDEEAPAVAAARIREAMADLARHADSLADIARQSDIRESAELIGRDSDSLANALENNDSTQALAVAEEELVPALEELSSRAVAVGQDSANDIAAASAGLGTVTTSARFVAALFVPALAVFLLYRALRRGQNVSLLKKELAREQELRRKQEAFVAAASHHVRNPLSALVGFADLLRDSSDDLSAGTRQELIELIAAESDATAHLVDDLFAAARFELEDFELEQAEVELRDVVDAVTSDWHKRHQMKLIISGNALVSGDERWLGHAIRNLLRAAASSGGERVEVEVTSDDARATVEISDDGAAISPEKTDGVSQLDQSFNGVDGLAPSVGVGLSVARRIAKSSGGDILYDRRDGSNLYGLILPRLESPREPKLHSDRVIDPGAGMPTSSAIEAVIASGGPQVHFQPMVELSSSPTSDHVVAGYEALARFPSHSPMDWFVAAERVGMQVDLELACIQAAIAAFDPSEQGVFLSVNVSDQTVHSPQFLDVISAIDPTQLVLEFADDAPVASYEETREVLEQLATSGIRVAIDGIGTVQLDLRHMTQLGVGIVKITPHLVKAAERFPFYRGMIKGVAALADELGAIMVAVGIETEEEHSLLADLGVRYGQGHLYSITPTFGLTEWIA